MAVLDRALFTNPIPSAPPGIQGMQAMAMPPRLRPDAPGGVMGFAYGGEVAPVRMADGGDPVSYRREDPGPFGAEYYVTPGVVEGPGDTADDSWWQGDPSRYDLGTGETTQMSRTGRTYDTLPIELKTKIDREAESFLEEESKKPYNSLDSETAEFNFRINRNQKARDLLEIEGSATDTDEMEIFATAVRKAQARRAGDAPTADETDAARMSEVINNAPGAEKVVSDVDNVMKRAEENEDPAAAMLSLVPDMHSQITDNPEENKRILGKWITQAASQSIGVDFNADDPQEDPARSHEASLALNLALIQAGAAMAGSQSPTFAGGLGAGAEAFATTLGAGLKDIKDREHELAKARTAAEGKDDTALIRNAQAYRDACLAAKEADPNAACDTTELGAMNWANQTSGLPEEVTKMALKCVQTHQGTELQCVQQAMAAYNIGRRTLVGGTTPPPAAGVGKGGATPDVGDVDSDLPRISSKKEYDELNVGDHYIDTRDGKSKRKSAAK